MGFTDRQNEILDEHFRDWFADYGTPAFAPDRDEVLDLIADRIRELDDEPKLKAELEAIWEEYQR